MPPSNRRPGRPSSSYGTTSGRGTSSGRTPSVRTSPSKSRKKRKKSANPTTRSFLIVVALLAVFAMVFRFVYSGGTSPFEPPETEKVALPSGGEIRVYFLDVGQGDSILLQTSEHNVLIDAAEYSSREALLSYLRDAGVTTIDYLIATHPHEDHIGGMVPVLNNFTVKEAVLSDTASTSATFENFTALLDEQKIPVSFPSPGEVITAGLIELEVLAPLRDYSDDLNNASLVLRMQYGDTAFLFTGDAEKSSENDMLDAGVNLRANILKVGHHGSNTSSSEDFIDAVRPSAVAISVGKHNSYGHPNDETLEAFEARDIPIYRTDRSGTVIMRTDGQKVELISGE